MTKSRNALPSPLWLVVLLGAGLGLGFLLRPVASHQEKRSVDIPWLDKAIRVITPGRHDDARTGSGLPAFALRATLVSTDPAQSSAIFDLGNGTAHALRPGDTLPGVGRLLEVAGNSVFLDVNGSRQEFFIERTPFSGQLFRPVPLVSQQASVESAVDAMIRRRSAPTEKFIVPENMPRYSDAPANEPELNATPRPGQSIDTTVWD